MELKNSIRIHRDDLSYLRKSTNTPIFAYCRKLVEEGHDPEKYLEIYGKHESWDFRVKIGEGSKLTVNEKTGCTFSKYSPLSHLKGR